MKIEIFNLEDLCEKIVDCPHSTPQWLDEGIPIIRNFNLRNGRFDFSSAFFVDEKTYKDRTKRIVPQYKDIIFSREAPIGDVAMIPENFKCCLGQRLVLLRANEQICSSEYLLYALQTEFVKKQIEAIEKTGSIVSNFNISDMKRLQIPVIDSGKKETIKLLEYIDKLLINNEEKIDLLNKTIGLIYNYWFVQFNFPNENNEPYKDNNGEFIKDVQLDYKIPKDWKMDSFLNHINWCGGAQPPKSKHIYEKREGYVRFIQNRDYTNNDNLTYIPISKSNKLCNKYDIMIDKYGDAGKTRYGIEGAYNVALSKIETKNYMQEYIRQFLSLDAIHDYLGKSCKASTRASLNEETFKPIMLLIPSQKVLNNFEQIAKKYIDAILELKTQNTNLERMKNYFLKVIISTKEA